MWKFSGNLNSLLSIAILLSEKGSIFISLMSVKQDLHLTYGVVTSEFGWFLPANTYKLHICALRLEVQKGTKFLLSYY